MPSHPEPCASDRAIVRPVISDRTPSLGPLAVMAGTRTDAEAIGAALRPDAYRLRDLFCGRLWASSAGPPAFSLAGPFVGAPAAVMALETLAAWGVRALLFFGWCGAIDPRVAVGDILVPSAALVDEGTSRHYGVALGERARPAASWSARVADALRDRGLACHDGPVWTTDAIFRETPAKVAHFRSQQALAVEMETSALFSVAAYRSVAAAAVLVVSDSLAQGTWQPGFKDPRFTRSREALCACVHDLGALWQPAHD